MPGTGGGADPAWNPGKQNLVTIMVSCKAREVGSDDE